MAVEIERKFLVYGEPWRQHAHAGKTLTQGYLNRDRERTVRVRIAGQEAFITVKGQNHGAARLEFEYPIPVADAMQLLTLCDGPLVEKCRHLIKHDGDVWEVDEFFGDNAGLVVAEIELDHECATFSRPGWLGDEVTGDPRYYNSALAVTPFCQW